MLTDSASSDQRCELVRKRKTRPAATTAAMVRPIVVRSALERAAGLGTSSCCPASGDASSHASGTTLTGDSVATPGGRETPFAMPSGHDPGTNRYSFTVFWKVQ